MDWLTEHAGLIGLLFFFCLFMVIALWTYRPGAKASYQKNADIPLNEDEDQEKKNEH